MTREEAIERARKLLALAQDGANEHESALAAGRAAELLARFELSAEALDDGGHAPDKDESIVDERIDDNGSESWRGKLLSGLARLHGCQSYTCSAAWGSRTGRYLIGRPTNVAACRYLYKWLAAEVQRLTSRHRGRGLGRAWLHSYRLGVVAIFLAEMRAADERAERSARGDAAGSTSALVVVESAVARRKARREEAIAYGARVHHLRSTRGRGASSEDGFATGRREGAGIAGASGGARIGGGSLRLGSGR